MRHTWVAVMLLGCGHAAPAPRPPSPPVARPAPAPDAAPPAADASAVALEADLPRLAARAVEMFQAWQRALEGAGDDCAKATAAMNQVAEQYADVIAANARVLAAGHDKIVALKQALAPHDAEMTAAAEAIVHAPAMAKCGSDQAFVQSIDRVGGSPP